MCLRSVHVVLLILPLLTSTFDANSILNVLNNGRFTLLQLLQTDGNSSTSPILKFLLQRFMQSQVPPKGDPGERNSGPQSSATTLWSNVFGSFGLPPKYMSTIAINIMVFVVQMVSDSFSTGNATGRRGKKIEKPLMTLVLEQPRVSRMLSVMQDPKLMDTVIQEVDSLHFVDARSECVQQLLCRSTPVVQGMQSALAFFFRQKIFRDQDGPPRGETGDSENLGTEDTTRTLIHKWNKMSPVERFFLFMPSMDDFMAAGAKCKKQYSRCDPYSVPIK